MDELFPNIPRLFTALAEWLSCLLFILTSRPGSPGGGWLRPPQGPWCSRASFWR